mmetsp:Transcript_32564/g.40360  ORF Transcript_32564/g.40360 Transcript_32564/m.40360 type:complete len:95 (-) Transcript_32564:62-346(-)
MFDAVHHRQNNTVVRADDFTREWASSIARIDKLVGEEIGDLDAATIDTMVDVTDLSIKNLEHTVENYVASGLQMLSKQTQTNSIFKNREAFTVV